MFDAWQIDDGNALMHYGVGKMDGAPVGSGRYPLGSGENPNQHSGDFLSRIKTLKKDGMAEKDIASMMGLTTTQLRVQMSLAKDQQRSKLVAQAEKLRADGLSLDAIAKEMGYNNDSSVRSLLNEKAKSRMNVAQATADRLRTAVEEKGMIDVGKGVENQLGVSKEKLNEALYILELEGYNTFGGGVPQVTNPGQQTNLRVLCPKDTPYKIKEVNGKQMKVSSAIYDFENVHSIDDYVSYDNGATFRKAFEYPASLDSKRLAIRYGDEGGAEKDGMIELRRGVEDISLGNSHYAQIRMLVDDTHYLKGMATYSDNLPDGVDVLFNTNKKSGTPVKEVLKPIKSDPDNPFGALIKEHGGQRYYDDPNGKYTDPETGKKQSLSLINKKSDEGDWGEWSKTLPSQFLSKQSQQLIDKQLGIALSDKKSEYDEICSLTNPTVKKKLLQSFADDCDAAAVHLKAAALPRQSYQVMLPLTTVKENEVYAPNYKNGETVALIRYPHGGTFEIPICKVNNKNKEGQSVITNEAADAIGISSKTAARLSGADFDGDTVMVIPCNSSSSKVKINSTPQLKGLNGFDPTMEYGGKPEGTFKQMGETYKQKQMGIVSNLITDMTLKGAEPDELAKAVRHSMVVIDAVKHKLDYQQSEIDNDIAGLKKKYQGSIYEDGSYHEGASTLISRAKSKEVVLKRKGSPRVNEDGSLSYKTVMEYYVDKRGKTQLRTQNSTKMAEAKDAYDLVSGTKETTTPQEKAYAEYANSLKALANQARKEKLNTGKIAYSASAKATYQEEVTSLNNKLTLAMSNKPKERQAQLIANSRIKAKKQEYPDLTKKELKKVKQQELTSARLQVGAKRTPVDITDKEWNAIQAGAISESKLNQILDNTDIDKVKQRATPRSTTSISPVKLSMIKARAANGYTIAEIADSLGISTSTVSKYLKGKV